MIRRLSLQLLTLVSLLLWAGCRQNMQLPGLGARKSYPETYADSSIVDDYHGTMVADPYRWLEDDRSAETGLWVKAQQAFTESYLAEIPFRPKIKERLEKLYNFERFGNPEVVPPYLYYSKNSGLQNQAILYRELIEGSEPDLVLDPNTFSTDQTASLAGTRIDPSGKYMAYMISEGGSDWHTLKILNLETLQNLPDNLGRIKFSNIAWLDNGFFYSRYPESTGQSDLSARNENHSLYFHTLGESQSQDRLIYSDPAHPLRNVSASISQDRAWLIRSTSQGTSGNDLAIAPMEGNKPGSWISVVEGFENDFNFIHGEGNELLFWTNANAPRGRLVKLNAADPAAGFVDLIPEQQAKTLKSIEVSGNRIYARYLENVSSKLEVFDRSGKALGPVELPGIGTASGVSAHSKGGFGYYSFSSFTTPGTIYRIDSSALQTSIWKQSDNGFDASKYQTSQIRYKSKDGTEVPMFVIHKKGLQLDGQRPTLIYGYGGFDISIEPQHSVMRLDLVSPILEQDGVVAVANLRGGGEFGAEWHKAGTKERKQNVFDDFIAAAEYLQKQGYTSPARTAIYGRSNGGLLVGACITQRPDLFGVAFPAVGVLDMLRYHQFTIGWAWAADYGRADSSNAFPYLYAYSPLHNIKEQAYPATMITTADHDDRVVPAHSFKFAAALQQAQQGQAPILIRIDESSGHGSGKPVAKQIDEAADVLAFMFYQMGLPFTSPGG